MPGIASSSVAKEIESFEKGAIRAPFRRIPVSDQIRDALHQRIISLELAPGASLSRQGIAEQYGVSQTPVRDAMMKLEQEGLLEVFPQSRTLVARIDIAHARETQFLRLGLELEVTRSLALAPDKSGLTHARKVLHLQEAALSGEDLDLFSALDRLFHQSLCEAAGVAAVWPVIMARSGHIDRMRTLNLPDPGKPANILCYHRRIIAGIEKSDLEETETAVREHLSGTLASAPAIMARYPDYF